MRMTLCRRGRSVLVLTFVFGLTTVSIIPAASPETIAFSSEVGTGSREENASNMKHASTGAPGSAGAAIRQALRQGLIAAADGRPDQFTGSGPVLKLGVLRQFQVDQCGHRAGFIQFRGLRGVIEQVLGIGNPDLGVGGEDP